MKKLFTILVIISTVLMAGNGNAMNQGQSASEKLELNNGAKWRVDSITVNNVKSLKAIASSFRVHPNLSLKSYHKCGEALQNGLAKMIRQCKMKGPDHLALHKWLEPLMEDVAKLNHAANAVTASNSFKAVALQLSRFDRYFEQ